MFYSCHTSYSIAMPLLQPQSHDCSCFVSRRTLAPPPRRVQKHNDWRAYDFAHFRDMRHQSKLTNITCAWHWRLYGITLPIQFSAIWNRVACWGRTDVSKISATSILSVAYNGSCMFLSKVDRFLQVRETTIFFTSIVVKTSSVSQWPKVCH